MNVPVSEIMRERNFGRASRPFDGRLSNQHLFCGRLDFFVPKKMLAGHVVAEFLPGGILLDDFNSAVVSFPRHGPQCKYFIIFLNTQLIYSVGYSA